MLLAVGGSSSFASRQTMPKPISLPQGITLISTTGLDGKTTDVYTDLANAIKVTSQFSVTGSLLSIEESTLGGAPIDIRVFESKRYFHETFPIRQSTIHRRVWHEEVTSKPDLLLITIDEQGSNGNFHYSYQISKREALSTECRGEFLDWLPQGGITPELIAPLRQSVNGLFDIDPNCNSFRSPQGGNMEDLVNRAVQGLLSPGCLPFRRPGDVARLISLIRPPIAQHPPAWGSRPIRRVRIACPFPGGRGPTNVSFGSVANTVTCSTNGGEDYFPRININAADMNFLGDPLTPQTLAHEIMHLLGYIHSENPDVAYLVQYCCFNEPAGLAAEAPLKRRACDHLGHTWENLGGIDARMAYGRDMLELMLLDDRGYVLMVNQLAGALHTTDPNQWAVTLGMAAFAAEPTSRVQIRREGFDVAAYIVARIALGLAPRLSNVNTNQMIANLTPENTSIRDFADQLAAIIIQSQPRDSVRAADLFGRVIGPNGERTAETVSFCASLDRNQRHVINNITSASTLSIIHTASTSLTNHHSYAQEPFNRAIDNWNALCPER